MESSASVSIAVVAAAGAGSAKPMEPSMTVERAARGPLGALAGGMLALRDAAAAW